MRLTPPADDAPTDHDPLVLLPGMNCSPRLWQPVVEPLVQTAGPRTIHAASLAYDSIDESVRQLLDTLPPRFALVGLSLGGIVAMAIIRQAPERVSRLCLLDTNGGGPTPDQIAAWDASRRRLAAGASARDLQQDLLSVLLSPAGRPALDEVVLQLAEECGADALDHQLAAQASRIDERPTLGMIKVPTMIICGSADALCPVSNHEEIQSLIRDSRLVILPEVGHLVTLESPLAVAQALADWLEP